MLNIHSKTFNPEVLYVFDNHSVGPFSGQKHAHDFLELNILLKGESYYVIDDETFHLREETVIVLNPGMQHMDYIDEGMENVQIHIGLRHFNFPGYKKDVLPLDSNLIQLGNYRTSFFETCEEIIRERKEAQPGYELILKALVFKLLIYLFRDKNTSISEVQQHVSNTEHQEFVNEVQLYIENHYDEDLTLDGIASAFYTNTATLLRLFKKFSDDTPINYLINYRLEKAKNLLLSDSSLSIKEVAESVGYEDSLYFSKLFKKKYGDSPSIFEEKHELKEEAKEDIDEAL